MTWIACDIVSMHDVVDPCEVYSAHDMAIKYVIQAVQNVDLAPNQHIQSSAYVDSAAMQPAKPIWETVRRMLPIWHTVGMNKLILS